MRTFLCCDNPAPNTPACASTLGISPKPPIEPGATFKANSRSLGRRGDLGMTTGDVCRDGYGNRRIVRRAELRTFLLLDSLFTCGCDSEKVRPHREIGRTTTDLLLEALVVHAALRGHFGRQRIVELRLPGIGRGTELRRAQSHHAAEIRILQIGAA
jgi:hypothetical protein